MKIDKNTNKILLVFSSLLVISSAFYLYFFQYRFKLIEEETNPAQKKIDKRCQNFDKVSSQFKELIEFEKNDFEKKKDIRLYFKSNELKPIVTFDTIKFVETNLTLKQIEESTNLYIQKIEPKIKKNGLIKINSFSFQNSLIYIYKQGDDLYNIQIPSMPMNSNNLDVLSIKCGQIDGELLNMYINISSFYKDNQLLTINQFSKNGIKIYVSNLSNLDVNIDVIKLNSSKNELIYSGKGEIKCSKLIENKVEGLECADD